jgi:hypothetical protein
MKPFAKTATVSFFGGFVSKKNSGTRGLQKKKSKNGANLASGPRGNDSLMNFTVGFT